MRRFLRLLLSRYAVSFLVIGVELFMILFGVVSLSSSSTAAFIISLLVDALILISVINSDCNPEYRVSWLVVILLLPLSGAVLYLLFGRRRVSPELLRREGRIAAVLSSIEGDEGEAQELFRISPRAAGILRSVMRGSPISAPRRGRAKYYSSGEEMYRDMLIALSSAKSFIFLEYFIVEDGVMWRGIFDILREKARAGVEVRLMYDDLGCMQRLGRRELEKIRASGISVCPFSRVLPMIDPRYNNRDHRKICVIDGESAFTGGVNIADEYIGKKRLFGEWKDGGVSICGDAVLGFTALFLSLWRLGDGDGGGENFEKYLKKSKERFTDGGFYAAVGTGPSSGPPAPGQRLIGDIIGAAERYVYITTPYLIIDHALLSLLVGAAARGVDVRIITPGIPDKRWIKVMTKGAYSALISGGVRIFEYTPGFLHEKILVADGEYSLVGSLNLDYRSLAHHYEDTLFSYRSPISRAALSDILEILAVSREIRADMAHLSLPERVLKSILTAVAPLL